MKKYETYIKQFDNFNGAWGIEGLTFGVYWLLPTGDKLNIALKKIGAPLASEILGLDIINIKENYAEIYVGYSTVWGWEWDNNEDSFKHQKCRFNGEIKISDLEVEMDKYNL